MAQLNIRLDDRLRDHVDSLARARSLSTSDLVRELIGQALGRDPDDPHSDPTPGSLSSVERRQLATQHEILANLSVDDEWEEAHHRQMTEILNSGFTHEYHKVFQPLRPEMTERECKLVHNILNMFTTLEASTAELSSDQRSALGDRAGWALSFAGFDFNNQQEARLARYARFVIDDDSWTDMAYHFDNEHERGNSHMPMLGTYQQMLSVWAPIWDAKVHSHHRAPTKYRFTVAELQEILSAC